MLQNKVEIPVIKLTDVSMIRKETAEGIYFRYLLF